MKGMNRILVAAIAAALGGYSSIGAMAPAPQLTAARGGGKSKSRAPHDGGGTRAFQRAALKKRNQQRHRKACRG